MTTTALPTGYSLIAALQSSLVPGFTYDPSLHILYLLSNNSIFEVNGSTNKFISSIHGVWASSITFDTRNGRLYFVGHNSTLFELDPSTNSYNSTGLTATAVWCYDPIDDEIFVEVPPPQASNAYQNYNNKTIEVINPTQDRIAYNITIPAFGYVSEMAFNPKYDYIYLLLRWGSADGEPLFFPFIIDASEHRVIASLPSTFVSFAYDSSNGNMFMADEGYIYKNCVPACYNSAALEPGNNVSSINGTKIIGKQITVNSSPNSTLGSIAYDNTNNNLYVSNSTVSIARDAQGAVKNISTSNWTISVINVSSGKVIQVQSLLNASYLFVDPANGNYLYVATPDALYAVLDGQI